MCLLRQSNIFRKIKVSTLFQSVIKESNNTEINQEFIELNFSLLTPKIKDKKSNTGHFLNDLSPLI